MWDCVTGKQIENNFGCIMADEMVCAHVEREEGETMSKKGQTLHHMYLLILDYFHTHRA